MTAKDNQLSAFLAESMRYQNRINLNLPFEYHRHVGGSYTLKFNPTPNGNIVFTDVPNKDQVDEYGYVLGNVVLSSHLYSVEVMGMQVNPRLAVQKFFDDYLTGVLTYSERLPTITIPPIDQPLLELLFDSTLTLVDCPNDRYRLEFVKDIDNYFKAKHPAVVIGGCVVNEEIRLLNVEPNTNPDIIFVQMDQSSPSITTIEHIRTLVKTGHRKIVIFIDLSKGVMVSLWYSVFTKPEYLGEHLKLYIAGEENQWGSMSAEKLFENYIPLKINFDDHIGMRALQDPKTGELSITSFDLVSK